jgi:hypothetical protein
MSKAVTERILFFVIAGIIILMGSGCTDTSVQNLPTSIDYKSQVKFINAAPVTGTATISMNGQQIGAVDPGNEIPGNGQAFIEIPAGSKTISVSYSNGHPNDDFKITTDTDYKLRLIIVGDSSGNTLVKSLDRYVWQDKGTSNGARLYPKDTAQVVFFNASPDITIDAIDVHTADASLPDTVYTSGTIKFDKPVKFQERTSYLKFYAPAPTDYNVGIVQNDSTITTVTVHAVPQGRLSTIIYDYSTKLKSSVLTDD